jgi:hypothetical protein
MLRSPLWSSGQSSWLQIQNSGFDSRRYQIFWEVVGLERVPLSLVSTIEFLLGRKSSGSGLESREYGRRDPSRWPRYTLNPQKLALTSPTSGGRSVFIVRSRSFFFSKFFPIQIFNLFFCFSLQYNSKAQSRNSSVGIATDYGLDDREVGIRVPVESNFFSSPRRPARLCGPPNGYREFFHRG